MEAKKGVAATLSIFFSMLIYHIYFHGFAMNVRLA